MTKVYLVFTEHRHYSNQKWNIANTSCQVFTNRKLAEAYAEYWNLKTNNWDKERFGEWQYKVKEYQICNIDYREDVLKEQMEQLPY